MTVRSALICLVALAAFALGGASPIRGEDDKLGHWKDCPFARSVALPSPLCRKDSSEVDDLIASDIRYLLRRRALDSATLCEIDQALVHAQEQCALDKGFVGMSVGDLMIAAGTIWADRNAAERAEQLFRRAAEIGRELGRLGLTTASRALHAWALLKLQQGDVQRARALAAERTQIVRRGYNNQRVQAGILIGALEFELGILLKAGLLGEAVAVRREIAELSKLPSSWCLGGECKFFGPPERRD